MQTRRVQKVAAVVQSALADILLRSISDPLLCAVHISGVELSQDLKQARVYYQTGRDNAEPHAQIQMALERATPFIKKKLRENVALRYVPHLKFELDTTLERAEHLFEIMRSLHHE